MNDEYMLVRKSDNAVVISRLILDDNGISTMPVMAQRGENKDLANSIHGLLESERAKRVSFAVLSK